MAKIDIVLPDLRSGGFEKVRVLLANEFNRLGHEISIVMMQRRGELLGYLDKGIEVIDLDVARGRQVVVALARSLRQRKPEALLAGLWPMTTAAALARLTSGHRCRLVLSEHNQLSRQYASWGRMHRFKLRASLALAHRLSDASVAVSKGVAADVACLSMLRPDAIKPIYNPAKFLGTLTPGSIAEAEALWAVPRGARILTVGNLKRQKNHALLLGAMARFDCVESRLIIVGEGELLDETKAYAASLGIDDRVIFAGYRTDPLPFYATADLFVLSSDYEGMPNVISEALSFGLPVVSTNCPSGPDEILQGGRYGSLTPVGEVEPLTAAIVRTLASPPDPALLRSGAESLSVEATAQQYLKLLLP